jgi:hypothetical protein
VAIDTSGHWWVGSAPEDVEPYLRAWTASSYPIRDFRLSRCGCGGVAFRLERDCSDMARRTCATCDAEAYICDSERYWEPPTTAWKCVDGCPGNICNVGVGYAGYDDDPSGIHWIYVGERCAECGVMGCFADWKVAIGDALYLLDKA